MNDLDAYLNTVEGMVLLATQQDDQTVSCVGADWFKYNGVVANTIYISGNSWIGIGTSSEQIKICRRDAKCHYLYRQEIAISELRCIKYRWDGYSIYNSTDDVNRLIWELFIFDNNDMFLNCVRVPTNGTNNFDTLGGTGTFNPRDNVYISLYCKDKEKGKLFNIVEEKYKNTRILIKYILKDDNGLYVVSEDNSSLIKLEETELSSSLFINKGMENIPNGNFMKDLFNPKALEFHMRSDVNIHLRASVKASPKIQTIIQSYDSFYSDETIKGIEYVNVIGEISDDAIFKIAISFDGGVTYESFINNYWINVDITNEVDFNEKGMSKVMIESLTKDILNDKFMSQDIKKYRFAFIIDYQTTNTYVNVEQIKIKYKN